MTRRRPRKTRHLARQAVLAAALLLSAHGAAWAGDDVLSVVKDGRTPPLMNALNLIAQGAGFYKAEHLTVTAIITNGSAEALQTCSSGKGDICPIGIEPLITRRDEGVVMKMFLSRASKFGYVIAVPQDSPIRTLSDFKGKSIGVHSTAGTSGVFTTQSALSAAGLQASDYQLVTIGLNEEAMAALASGKVSAAALPYYELIPFMVAGQKLRILRHPTLGDTPNAGYAAAPSVLEAKGDAVKRFSRAIVQASLLVRYNPAAAARDLLTADGKPFTEADLQRKTAELTAWEDDLPASDPTNPRIGAMSMSGMQAYIQLLKDAGVAKEAIPASQVVTEETIAFANAFDRKAFEAAAKAAR